MGNFLKRREGESIVDHVQRLLADPLVKGLPDADIAPFVHIAPKRVREIRQDMEGQTFAGETAAMLVRPEGETVVEFMRAAVTWYAWKHCEAGRCKHALCARMRAREALRRSHARPTHDTRHPQAHGARNPAFSGARPLDQSRGAPGTRNPGGASARFDGGGDGHTGR